MNQERSWMNDPALQHIDREKLIFLQNAVFDSKNLTQKEMMPFLMAMAQKAKKNRIQFSEAEMKLIVDALKKTSTKEDLAKINQALTMTRMFQH